MEVPGNIIFTAAISVLRKIKDPTDVMEYWKEAMVFANNFAGFPNGTRNRTERAVCDKQISSGLF